MRGEADESWMDAAKPTADTSGLAVRFEMYPHHNAKKSAEEGRPIYDEKEYIHIRVLGDRDNTVHRPVREDDKRRFAEAYRRWKATGVAEGVSGTPLKEWAPMARNQVLELEHFGISTVEQLAQVTDGNLQRLGPLQALRQKARDYVEQAKGAAPLQQMRDELEAAKREAELMRRQMAELAATVEEKKARKSKEA